MEQYFFLNAIMSQAYVDCEWTLCGKLHPLEVSNFILLIMCKEDKNYE